jgi:hypothetical protein
VPEKRIVVGPLAVAVAEVGVSMSPEHAAPVRINATLTMPLTLMDRRR